MIIMLRMSLRHAYILLNNGVADLTMSFNNSLSHLSEFIIQLLKLKTNLRKVHRKMECLNSQTF